MCGTSPTALSPYSASSADTGRPRPARAGGITSIRLSSRDQPFQARSVSNRDTAARPTQARSSPPHSISCGTMMPDAAIPSPTPVNIMPPTRPRRRGGVVASTIGAPTTISTPPA